MKQAKMLVLGASGGIGAATCRQLVGGGARVMMAGRNTDTLGSLATELGAEYQAVDATDIQAVAELVESTRERLDGLDGVANCVGSLVLKPAHVTTPEEWHDTVATNLTSAFAVVRAAAKAMISSGGSIVLVSTAAAAVGLANHEAIAAAKGGVEGLALSAAATYASKGVRVNVVAPGLTETPMTRRITANEKSAETSRRMHALGRLGQPEDVARAIAFLLDPESSWITGQVLGVDGGLARVRAR